MARYEYLLIRQKSHEIEKLEVHPRYQITINGVDCGYYEADFKYLDCTKGRYIVEDVKGSYWKKKKQMRKGVVIREWKEKSPILTDLYRLKRKLTEALYGINIVEIWDK